MVATCKTQLPMTSFSQAVAAAAPELATLLAHYKDSSADGSQGNSPRVLTLPGNGPAADVLAAVRPELCPQLVVLIGTTGSGKLEPPLYNIVVITTLSCE